MGKNYMNRIKHAHMELKMKMQNFTLIDKYLVYQKYLSMLWHFFAMKDVPFLL